MWTFLGIASFTYLYKKSDSVWNLVHTELLLTVVLFLTAGLLLSNISCFQQHKLRLSQIFNLSLSLLSSLPIIKHLIPNRSAQSPDSSCRKVRQEAL